MVGDAVKQGGGHFGVTKNLPPFAKFEIGGDDDAGVFIEF